MWSSASNHYLRPGESACLPGPPPRPFVLDGCCQHAADGFHRVMFWAGLLAIFSLVLLIRLRLPRVQAAPTAAVELH